MKSATRPESKEQELGKSSIEKILQYGAAVLSFVSFLTTANGMQQIVDENKSWQAYLISFGIQVIVLVLGTRFIDICQYFKQNGRRWLIGLMAMLYLCAIGFSSTFSYVFLAEGAYKDNQASNYNIELEQFLVTESKNLKNTNDAAGRVILSEMQKLAPEFRSVNDAISQMVQSNAQQTAQGGKPSKNLTSEIPGSYYYNAAQVIDRENAENREGQKDSITQHESLFKELGEKYKTYYQKYSEFYEGIDSLSDAADAKRKSDDISRNITEIDTIISQIQGVHDLINKELDNTLNDSKQGFEAEYTLLRSSFEGVKSIYDAFSQEQIEQLHDVDIQRIYKTIYSPEDVPDEEIDSAITNLKNLTTAYLEHTDSVDDALIQSLSGCIIYLGEFKKYQTLDRQMEDFETEHLRRAYIIEDAKPEDAPASESESNPEPFHESTSYLYNQVNTETWTRARQEDLAVFVRLLKTLPDVELLVQTISGTAGHELEKYSDYVNDTLEKAYKLEHQKLSKLNTIETALNYLFRSEFPAMAWFCLLVAYFMDIAAFLIGIALYFIKKREETKAE